jgi:HSP20 family molecular chaperone IbpA
MRSGWQLGWWELTDRALQFGRPNKTPMVSIRLGRILGVEEARRKFLVARKPVLKVKFLSSPSMTKLECWLITADIEPWRRELAAAVPQHRFAADVPVEIYLETDEVVVVAQLPTASRDDPPAVKVAADRRSLVLTTETGGERQVTLPVEVVGLLSVDVGATAAMVIRLQRIGSPSARVLGGV